MRWNDLSAGTRGENISPITAAVSYSFKMANQSECGTLIKDQWEQPLVCLERGEQGLLYHSL